MSKIQNITVEVDSVELFQKTLDFIFTTWFDLKIDECHVYTRKQNNVDTMTPVLNSLPIVHIVNEYYSSEYISGFEFKKEINFNGKFQDAYEEIKKLLQENFLEKKRLKKHWLTYKKLFMRRDAFDLDGFFINAHDRKITIGICSIDNPE